MPTITRSRPPGSTVLLRPVESADAEAMQAFVAGLGAASRRWRFHCAINACSPGLLRHLTDVDGRRHVAFVACAGDRIVGEARYFVAAEGDEAEFAICVADAFCGHGVASALMDALTDAARSAGITRLYGEVLHDNERMAAFMTRHGFMLDPCGWDGADAEVVRWQRSVAMPALRPSRAPWPVSRRPWLPRLLGRWTRTGAVL